MSLIAISPLVELFRYSLKPIAPFTWFGFPISTLDVVATFRLCVVLRQIREITLAQHISTKKSGPVEERSFIRNLLATWLVVYGGEAITAPMLGLPPSFMISGVIPGLYAAVQALVDYIPAVPAITAETELPLAVLDGFTRAYLLCNLIPPSVTANSSSLIASSPWALLLTSLVTANAGFFFINFFSFLNPTPLAVQTPPELQPYGWTTADLWCAPVTTALYALLTHAQPFWTDLHSLIVELLGGRMKASGKPIDPVDPEVARAVCALLLSTLFVGRATRNFGLWKKNPVHDVAKGEKQKTQ